jgi:phenylacetyl-CoA:acceptor oxidoreductase 26-kDa subunit
MSYGPNPWQQTSWDWRAAGNFMAGGAGAGLVVFGVLADAQGLARAALLLGGLALIGLGLLCVWLEIGRPLRALNVFFNPRSSWMTREAFTGALLMPCGLAAALGVPGFAWPTLALALLFVYTQSRIVMGARGIPAWREPRVSPLLVATGLAEGGGLFWLFDAWHGAGTPGLLLLFGLLVLARVLLWLAYRRRLVGRAAERANQALDRAGRPLQLLGSLLPLVVVALVALGLLPPGAVPALIALAGLAAALSGAWMKFTLITRAGFNQGFALQRLPVRGVRRETAAAPARPGGG